jgi:hypothetical protein
VKAALLGIGVFAAHVAFLPVALDRCRRPELEVRLADEPGTGPPGLHYRRWRAEYRGGFVREVGAAQLVGRFQDAPACGARLVVGEAFLQSEIAPLVQKGLEDELRGFSQFPAGDFERVSTVEVGWADDHARVRAVVELERVSADVVVRLTPRVAEGRLRFDLRASAKVRSGVGIVDWTLERFDADDYATRVIRDQLDETILSAFDPPPPLELPGGRSLTITYCPGAPIEIAHGSHAALPLALGFGPGPGNLLPPRLGPAQPPPVPPGTSLAFDLDLDTVNALLHELWRTGFLDEQLDRATLDARFNEDPTVQSLLSVRISPVRLALPPFVSPGPHGLRMAADLRVNLADRDLLTPARLWAALDVALTTQTQVDLAELELTCEPAPRTLRPCYGDLVTAARARAPDARAELSALLVQILDDVVTGRRVTAPDAPAELVLGSPTTTSHASGPSATVRIAIQAHLAPIP